MLTHTPWYAWSEDDLSFTKWALKIKCRSSDLAAGALTR